MKADADKPRRILALINPKSGTGFSLDAVRDRFLENWDLPDTLFSIMFSQSREDGERKVREALAEGVDTLLVAGGDGMINTIGQMLIDTPVSLGVIPTGSGNGFARHFGVPLGATRAIASLARAETKPIDVGYVNGHPFFVTCSVAWDAALVKTFEKSPVRGILPYVVSGMYNLFEYIPKPFDIELDGSEPLHLEKPMLCTIANLTQYGGGAQIAPQASHDDGYLELVFIERRDTARAVANFHRLYDGTLDRVPEVQSRRFRSLRLRREQPGPVQIDGELLPDQDELHIEVRPKCLNVLVPRASA